MDSDSDQDATPSPPPAKKPKAAVSGAATYSCKYKPEWEVEFPFVAQSPSSSSGNFFCRVCKKEISCRHQGKADVRRHEKGNEHQRIVRGGEGCSRLDQFGFVPIGTALDTQVSMLRNNNYRLVVTQYIFECAAM